MERSFATLQQAKMVAKFRAIMQDASPSEWYFFLRPHMLTDCVYIVDPVSRSKRQATVREVGWPVLWLLGSHHKKHIFIPPRLPHFKHVISAVGDMIAKIRWRFMFESGLMVSSGKSAVAPPRSSRMRTHPCDSEAIPFELNLWCKSFRQRIYEHCNNALRKAKASQQTWWSNQSGIVRLAFLALRHSPWTVNLSDKDGGFVLVDRIKHRTAMQQALHNSKYISLSIHSNMTDIARRGFSMLMGTIFKRHKDKSLVKELSRGSKIQSLHDLVAPVTANYKTHKDQGNISIRVLHDNSSTPFLALGRWISKMVRPALLQQGPHIVINTPGLLTMINSVSIEPNDMLVKADVKDYFMSGSHANLAEYTSRFCDADYKSSVKDACEFLLHYQFVNLDEQNAEMHQVVEGAGMGLNASGDIADCAFLCDRERSFILRKDIIKRYNIKLYARVKDDIFMILGESPHRTKIARDWNIACPGSNFVIDKWEASMEGVEIVDLFVYRQHRASNRLSYHTHFKESSLGIPLNPSSAHNQNIIRSWPIGELDRFAKNSSSHFAFLETRKILVKRLTRFLYPASVIAKIEATDPYFKKVVQKAMSKTKSHFETVESTIDIFKPKSGAPTFWFVFPSHPIWEKSGLNKCIESFIVSERSSLLMVSAARSANKTIGTLSLKAAWRNTHPMLISRLRRI